MANTEAPTSLIAALLNIVKYAGNSVSGASRYNNRVNAVGEGLEDYVKRAFAGAFGMGSEQKAEKFSQVFSWLGNQNNPPDIIIKNSDAVEVKKLEGVNTIALNSSYPDAKLYSSSTMITKACRESEGKEPWVKDLIYAIGTLEKGTKTIKYLFFVYGTLYAADKEVYERAKESIKLALKSSGKINLSETKELGRVNKVDPLGITYLRVRGMWHIAHPFKAFSYMPEAKQEKEKPYTVYALIPMEKFKEFDSGAVSELLKYGCVKKYDVKAKDPNNPANLIGAVLIKVFPEECKNEA